MMKNSMHKLMFAIYAARCLQLGKRAVVVGILAVTSSSLAWCTNLPQELTDFRALELHEPIKNSVQQAGKEMAACAKGFKAAGHTAPILDVYSPLSEQTVDMLLGDPLFKQTAQELFDATIEHDGVKRLFAAARDAAREQKPLEERKRSWNNFFEAYSTIKSSIIVRDYFSQASVLPWFPQAHSDQVVSFLHNNLLLPLSEQQSRALMVGSLLEGYLCQIHHAVDPELDAHHFDAEDE